MLYRTRSAKSKKLKRSLRLKQGNIRGNKHNITILTVKPKCIILKYLLQLKIENNLEILRQKMKCEYLGKHKHNGDEMWLIQNEIAARNDGNWKLLGKSLLEWERSHVKYINELISDVTESSI